MVGRAPPVKVTDSGITCVLPFWNKWGVTGDRSYSSVEGSEKEPEKVFLKELTMLI
jgi:hypothetical protein